MRWWRTLFLTKTGFAILLGVVFGLFGWVFPFLPRQYSTADFLIVGASSFALTLLPNSRRYVPGFLRRVLNYTVPNSIIVVAMLLLVTATSLWDAHRRYPPGADSFVHYPGHDGPCGTWPRWPAR